MVTKKKSKGKSKHAPKNHNNARVDRILAFDLYMGMRDRRSLKNVAEALKVHEVTIRRISIEDNWNERVKKIEKEAISAYQKAQIQEVTISIQMAKTLEYNAFSMAGKTVQNALLPKDAKPAWEMARVQQGLNTSVSKVENTDETVKSCEEMERENVEEWEG